MHESCIYKNMEIYLWNEVAEHDAKYDGDSL